MARNSKAKGRSPAAFDAPGRHGRRPVGVEGTGDGLAQFDVVVVDGVVLVIERRRVAAAAHRRRVLHRVQRRCPTARLPTIYRSKIQLGKTR